MQRGGRPLEMLAGQRILVANHLYILVARV
jgi:type IV secretory pathway protease TraF